MYFNFNKQISIELFQSLRKYLEISFFYWNVLVIQFFENRSLIHVLKAIFHHLNSFDQKCNIIIIISTYKIYERIQGEQIYQLQVCQFTL